MSTNRNYTLQNELVALGIGQIVNSLFSFIDNIVSDAALSAQIAKCFKLTGIKTLTGNISASSDTYTLWVLNLLKLLIYLVLHQVYKHN